MKLKISNILIFLALQLTAFGQTDIIEGIVQNSETKESIPFAHCLFLGTSNGFVTNVNGKFKEKSPSTNYEIKISAIGYRTKITKIFKGEYNVIELEPDITQLSEVVVFYKDKERELLEKVLENIPQNYPQKIEKLQGTVVEQLANDSLYNDLIYSADTQIEADKFSYSKPREFGNVKIMDGEVVYHQGMDSSFIKVMAGAHNVHRFDVLASRMTPFDKIQSRRHDYEIVDTLIFEGKALFKMQFETPKYKGYLYIQDKTFALIKGEYTLQENKLKTFGGGGNRLFLHFTTEYFKEDSVYRLNYINYRTGFSESENNVDRKVYLNNFFYLKDHNQLKKLINYNDQVNFEDILIYNLPTENHSDTSQIKSINTTERKLSKILKNLTAEQNIGLLEHRYIEKEIQISSLNINERITSSAVNLVYMYKLGYEFSNAFSLEYITGGSFTRNLLLTNTIQLKFNQPVSKDRRLILSVSGGANLVNYNTTLEDIENREGVIENTAFQEGAVQLTKQFDQFNLISELQLKYRLGTRLFLTLGIVAPFNLHNMTSTNVIQNANEAIIKNTDTKFKYSYHLVSLGLQMHF